jgi:transcriptional regulator of acetoin/glycerol metabolism
MRRRGSRTCRHTADQYAWPGNIRELRNVTRQLVIEAGPAHVRIDPRLAEQLGMQVEPGTHRCGRRRTRRSR